MKLVRAWACYWIMMGIDGALGFLPRSRFKARLVNFLCAPFFGPGGYWALRQNPKVRDKLIEMEMRP